MLKILKLWAVKWYITCSICWKFYQNNNEKNIFLLKNYWVSIDYWMSIGCILKNILPFLPSYKRFLSIGRENLVCAYEDVWKEKCDKTSSSKIVQHMFQSLNSRVNYIFVCLPARSVRKHAWVQMGPDSNKMLKPGFKSLYKYTGLVVYENNR